MRVEKSLKNIAMSFISQMVLILLGFISRKVFLDSLGLEYLGVNGLLTNIISMLSLVEGGIGTSIVYNLYKPLAQNNEGEITALVKLYKKIYRGLALGILGLSIAIYPIVFGVVKNDSNITNIVLIYFIFVFNNMIFYFNAHKWSLINADQKGYVLEKYNLFFSAFVILSKIAILYYTKNYILFISIEFITNVIQNFWNGHIVNMKYPYIKCKTKYEINKGIKREIIKNSKALFLHNVGTYCVFGTDNLLISIFINLKTVGLYSTYSMIISQLTTMVNLVLNGAGASVGNLIATEDREKAYNIFKVIHLVSFWLYSIATIFLFIVLEQFITWFYGEGLLLSKNIFFIILLNFYLSGMRNCILMFKSKSGIFNEDKFLPLVEAAINLILSVILVKSYGLVGIFLGTTISTLIVPFWSQSKLVYNKVFDKSFVIYIRIYIKYLIICLIALVLTSKICAMVFMPNTFLLLVVKGILSICIPSVLYFFIFFNSCEGKYLINVFLGITNKIKEGKIRRSYNEL